MPEKRTIERAREDARRGKSPSTQAGEFVREEMDHIREGKHGARSPQQAIAVDLSVLRRNLTKCPIGGGFRISPCPVNSTVRRSVANAGCAEGPH